MKPLFAALAVAFLLGTTVNVHAAEQAKPADRSVQVYKKADLAEWNRENAAGGKGPLLGRFAFNRHQTAAQDAFREIGWLTLPPGASIGEHKHTDNEDVYIIVSGKGMFTDSTGKQTPVGAGDITIARPGQSHALKNIGKKPLVFLDLIAETAAAQTKTFTK